MLDRVDRIQMAVAEATPVARAFQDIPGGGAGARRRERLPQRPSHHPGARRIEISQVTDPKSPMGRWAAKPGDSLYRHHARFTPRGGDPLTERDGLWIHPSALSGLLLGISRATVGRAGPSSSRTDGTTMEAPS